MKRMAVISAGFVPVPAVDGGAGEELTTEIIKGNEKKGDYFMDIYTIESPKLCNIKYKNAEVIQLHISKLNWFFCKARNAFLKLFNRRYRFIPYNRVLLKKFRDNYDLILIENNMQVYEDIYKHMKRSKNNMIYHMHNDIDGTTKPEYLCRYITDTAKVILPVSKYIKNRVENCSPNNITEVFYNCIDTRKFNRNKEFDCNKIKEKYDIEANDFVYMYAGSVYKGKGVLELVKAFKKVSKECNNVKLLIVGSTWYNLIDKDEYYVRLIKEIEDIKDNVIFTGYVYPNDMPEFYSIADVMVISSICEEAFPLVALESMAMGKAIVSTNSGGIVESLISGTAIMVDKSRDVIEGLYCGMKELYDNDELRKQIAENAYNEFISNKNYNVDLYYDTFKEKIGKYIEC
ncbi:MAG: glycosyltransferase family 4 protein [Eubacterium sp.]|uniref:glycosyltransferase family 4 protein n=1 Tax=Eubacterium sp. TaxID=142586 RepID=UPI003991C45F